MVKNARCSRRECELSSQHGCDDSQLQVILPKRELALSYSFCQHQTQIWTTCVHTEKIHKYIITNILIKLNAKVISEKILNVLLRNKRRVLEIKIDII